MAAILIHFDPPEDYKPWDVKKDDPDDHRLLLAEIMREAISRDDFVVLES